MARGQSPFRRPVSSSKEVLVDDLTLMDPAPDLVQEFQAMAAEWREAG